MPFVDTLKARAGGLGRSVVSGLEGAAAMATVGGAYMAASKVYNHLTKARDFKGMMASPFNNDLQSYHEAEPEKFNAAYTSLRTVNPELTRDPMVAGAYMRRVMTYDNAGATGVLVEALSQKNTAPPSPVMDLVGRGAQMGVQGVYTDRANKAMDLRQGQVERLRLQARDDHDPTLSKLRAAKDVENASALERDIQFQDYQDSKRQGNNARGGGKIQGVPVVPVGGPTPPKVPGGGPLAGVYPPGGSSPVPFVYGGRP